MWSKIYQGMQILLYTLLSNYYHDADLPNWWNFNSLSPVFLQVSYGPRRSAMKNTAASTNILEFIWVWLRSGQNYHKALMMLARNSPCSQEVGLGKLMILIGIYWGRLSLTFRDELSSWFMAGRVGNTNGFSLSS